MATDLTYEQLMALELHRALQEIIDQTDKTITQLIHLHQLLNARIRAEQRACAFASLASAVSLVILGYCAVKGLVMLTGVFRRHVLDEYAAKRVVADYVDAEEPEVEVGGDDDVEDSGEDTEEEV